MQEPPLHPQKKASGRLSPAATPPVHLDIGQGSLPQQHEELILQRVGQCHLAQFEALEPILYL